jgi:hypothetical protein
MELSVAGTQDCSFTAEGGEDERSSAGDRLESSEKALQKVLVFDP